MCGILAYSDRKPVEPNLLNKMRDTMTHRGPDGYGTYFSNDGKLGLAHRRLSIIDLSDNGDQPMCNEDQSIWLSFNGEIYNFKELRNLLEKKGHRFKSKSDSEIVVHAYEEWGEECPQKLWGMFAFVIWDEKKKIIFGARDRLGVKPFHYFHYGDTFICASEIKAIVENPFVPRQIDRGALCDYLTYRYIPSPKTIWKNIRKLPPGHAFTYCGGSLKIWRYWTLEAAEREISEINAVEELEALFTDAVRRRLVSDVPVGLLISGGLDSTAIAWKTHQLNKELEYFTIGFTEGTVNEIPDAEQIALLFKSKHHIEYLNSGGMITLSDLMWYFDEPFGASSMIPTYLVSKVAGKYVKVALSGDGGDEAFAGYSWYDTLLNSSSLSGGTLGKEDNRNIAGNYVRATSPRFQDNDFKILFNEFIEPIPDHCEYINGKIHPGLTGIKQFQWLDTHTFLPEEVLTKVDRASMANSLEVRSPFLDHRIYEWVFSLSEKVYFSGEKKKLIKKLLNNKVPDRILRKKKQGFSAPVRKYWSGEWINQLLLQSKMVKDGVIREDFIKTIANNPSSVSTYPKRWLLAVLEVWYRKWVLNEN